MSGATTQRGSRHSVVVTSSVILLLSIATSSTTTPWPRVQGVAAQRTAATPYSLPEAYELTWLRQVDGTGSQTATKVVVDAKLERVVSVGHGVGDMVPGGVFDVTDPNATPAATDGWITSHSLDGKLAWARQFSVGGERLEQLHDVIVAGDVVYVTGASADSVAGTNIGQEDIIVVWFDAVTGNTVGSHQAGTSASDLGLACVQTDDTHLVIVSSQPSGGPDERDIVLVSLQLDTASTATTLQYLPVALANSDAQHPTRGAAVLSDWLVYSTNIVTEVESYQDCAVMTHAIVAGVVEDSSVVGTWPCPGTDALTISAITPSSYDVNNGLVYVAVASGTAINLYELRLLDDGTLLQLRSLAVIQDKTETSATQVTVLSDHDRVLVTGRMQEGEPFVHAVVLSVSLADWQHEQTFRLYGDDATEFTGVALDPETGDAFLVGITDGSLAGYGAETNQGEYDPAPSDSPFASTRDAFLVRVPAAQQNILWIIIISIIASLVVIGGMYLGARLLRDQYRRNFGLGANNPVEGADDPLAVLATLSTPDNTEEALGLTAETSVERRSGGKRSKGKRSKAPDATSAGQQGGKAARTLSLEFALPGQSGGADRPSSLEFARPGDRSGRKKISAPAPGVAAAVKPDLSSDHGDDDDDGEHDDGDAPPVLLATSGGDEDPASGYVAGSVDDAASAAARPISGISGISSASIEAEEEIEQRRQRRKGSGGRRGSGSGGKRSRGRDERRGGGRRSGGGRRRGW